MKSSSILALALLLPLLVSVTGEFPYFKILRGEWREELGVWFDVAVGLSYRRIEVGEESLTLRGGRLSLGRKIGSISRTR